MIHDAYNSSSLAVDFDPRVPQLVPDQPRLISARKPGIGGQGARMFQGLDSKMSQRDRTSVTTSFFIHSAFIATVLWLGLRLQSGTVLVATQDVTPLHFTLYEPPPPVMQVAKVTGGGGGGGEHRITPPVRGHVTTIVQPKVSYLPPQIARIQTPKLPAEPTMQVKMPDNTKLPNMGMPHEQQVALASQGSGSGSGFGFGMGGGMGSGHGNGAGPGSGGGSGGGLMSVGGGVSAPQVIHSAEPEFTDDARRADFQGSAAIQLIVDAQGNPQDIVVLRHLGMGLDEKAVEAVRQYKFRPAMYQGRPVAVQMVIELDFHLH